VSVAPTASTGAADAPSPADPPTPRMSGEMIAKRADNRGMMA